MPGPGWSAHQRLDLLRRPVARADMVADVGPVEAGDDQPVFGNAELDEDVGARALVGGRGQRQPRHFAMLVEQRQQQAVVGPEIMAPFGNAMRLVDREQGDVGFLQQPRETLGRRPLGRDVEQVELAIAKRVADRARVLAGAGQRGGAEAEAVGARAPGPASARSAAR